MTLFNKALIFGDIHFGKKNNDRQFNLDCTNYIDWLITQGKKHSVDCVIFLGDWHDNRHSIHLNTLNSSLDNIKKLNDNFSKIFFIEGNHDLFYKDKRDVSSISIAEIFPNINVINDITHVENVTFFPWLVGNEWEKVKSLADNSDYVFGHFELPSYMVNSVVEMPETGHLNAKHLKNVKYMTFSGHFHKRQIKNKVCYIGSPFPHDFSDVWDDDRGLVILEYGKQPEFINWRDGPKYRSFSLSEVLDGPDNSLSDKVYAKISIDIDLNYDEEQYIKDVLSHNYQPRRMEIIPKSKLQNEAEITQNIDFLSVNNIVIEGLKKVESTTLSSDTLIKIYNEL